MLVSQVSRVAAYMECSECVSLSHAAQPGDVESGKIVQMCIGIRIDMTCASFSIPLRTFREKRLKK